MGGCRNGKFPSGAIARMRTGMQVIYIAKAFLRGRKRNIVATLLAYNVEYDFTTMVVVFRLVC